MYSYMPTIICLTYDNINLNYSTFNNSTELPIAYNDIAGLTLQSKFLNAIPL